MHPASPLAIIITVENDKPPVRHPRHELVKEFRFCTVLVHNTSKRVIGVWKWRPALENGWAQPLVLIEFDDGPTVNPNHRHTCESCLDIAVGSVTEIDDHFSIGTRCVGIV